MSFTFDPFRVLGYALNARFPSYNLGGGGRPGQGKGHDHGKGHGHHHDDDHCEVPCFTSGTMITTIGGDCPVELLREGDRVLTRDNGVQRITWCGRVTLKADQLRLLPELRPVRIRAGALNGIGPRRDMVVSPNHRILLCDAALNLLFGESEVLVAAQHLVGLPGIETVEEEEVTYVHVMMDRHELILGDGAWSESFRPGDYMMSAMSGRQSEEILSLFPDLAAGLRAPQGFTLARRQLRRREAELFVHVAG